MQFRLVRPMKSRKTTGRQANSLISVHRLLIYSAHNSLRNSAEVGDFNADP